jgi:hypothetical protein
MKKILSLLLLSGLLFTTAFAQEEEQPEPQTKKTKYTKNTFRATRIINMQNVEMGDQGYLQFMISHHFGNLWYKDGGAENLAQLLGLNSGVANTYLSFDYTPVNRVNIGIAFTGNAIIEGYTKIKLLRQQTGARNIPVTVVWHSLAQVNAQKNFDDDGLAWNRFAYLHQLLIARKITPEFSLQLSPTLVHYNMVPYGYNNSNNIFSLGIGGRYSITDKKAVTLEYSRQFNMYKEIIDKSGNIHDYQPDLLAVGMEFFTGGHVFQFYIGSTNLASNVEQLSRNPNKISKGQFAFGFHMNRSFFIGKE